MSSPKKKRFAFRPTVTESRLEERVVLSALSSAAAAARSKVYVLAPPTRLATAGLTPAPAPSPVSARVAARRAALEAGVLARPLTIPRLQKAYRQQVHAATRDLRAAIQTDINRLRASGSTPTAQQIANFNAGVAGALNATSLRLATQASLLPNGGSRLVPTIENRFLGSGTNSLASRLSALATSGRLVRPNGTLSPAFGNLTTQAARQGLSLVNSFFNTTPVAQLSVNSAGVRIPIQQFIGNQLLNQVGNTLGSLASSFPTVANSMLFPNGTTVAPTQAAVNNFVTAFNNALNTAAFQLGSGLALFPGNSGLVSQIQPVLFGTTGTTGATGTFGSTGGVGSTTGGSTFNGLASALQGLPFGTTGFNTAATGAFNSAFQNLVTPVARFFGASTPLTTLPTSGFTSVFGSPFTGSSFFNGFNGGFATGTTPGFIGFGMAPTGFNTSFGTGFNNAVTGFNTGLGFTGLGAGSGVSGIGSGLLTGTGGGIGGLGSGSGGTGLGSGSGGTGLGAGSGVGGIGSGLNTGTGGGIT